MFALEKPKPKQSTPCDEWISKIAPLAHIVNEKAKSYAVGFFNGDIKVYSSEHAELLNVSQLHYNAQVSDMLYFKSDTLDANLVVSCSEQPDPQLIVAKLGADKKTFEVIARAKDELMEETMCGYTCLAQNPLQLERFVSSSQIIEDPDQGI